MSAIRRQLSEAEGTARKSFSSFRLHPSSFRFDPFAFILQRGEPQAAA
jgi:hypothetical protein